MLREVEARASASVAELSEATGLHENTVRGHLDRLCGDGYLRSERALPTGRGRPSSRWHAVRTESRNPYANLAIALASTLSEADVDAANLMRAAGVSWGTQLAAEQQSTSTETHQLVFDVMQDQGFAPERVEPERVETERMETRTEAERTSSGNSGREILLRSCPILEAAKGNTDVVCAAHLGLVEGLIGTRGDQLEVVLEPLVAPDVCVLRLGFVA